MPFGLGFFAAAGASAAATPAFELIQSFQISSDVNAVFFSSLPTTGYRHLQIRFVARSTHSQATDVVRIRPNSNASFVYRSHHLLGAGSIVQSTNFYTDAFDIRDVIPAQQIGANEWGVSIIDLLDYRSTAKTKTFRAISGSIGGPRSMLSSGLWNSTSAVNSIELNTWNGNFLSGSRFSVYGIRG